MPLTFFLGLCTLFALSRKTGPGLGVSMIAVMVVTVPLNHLINTALLAPGAWVWLGLPDTDLSYLRRIAFIGVIAATLQQLEMVLDRFFPAIYASFGFFLPLLTVQCAILGGSLFMVDRKYGLAESAVFGLGAGFAVAVVMLGAIRARLAYADLPRGLRGLCITFIIAGMMSMGFSAFAQMVAS